MEISYWAKFFLTLGVIFIAVGLVLLVLPRIPGLGRLGHLPGDIVYRKGNFVFYFPLATSILLSLLLTLILTLLLRR
ncbi:MAG: DUF2905 domain-containing protein [Candidatus Atribacteria bacterium]|nr:DUF2905 domain-containing protein [Candidatus Atribacteria bacterium]